MRRRDVVKALAAASAAAALPIVAPKIIPAALAADSELKVGVLFPLSGTIAVIGRSLHNATMLAIDEINASGGVAGRKIRAVVRDSQSSPAVYAEKIRGLILADHVLSTFGGYTSASRKAVLPAVEKYNSLYWYPTLYEGDECSKNVIYTGAVPNQQQKELIPWLLNKFGKRFYLIGSNYIYPKDENRVCKALLKKYGGTVVNEEYVPLGHSEFSDTIEKFKALKPNVIFSTVVGDSVIALHRQYANAGLDPKTMPMASLTTSEQEVQAMGGKYAAGHFTSAPYFMSLDIPENKKFVAAYQKRFGNDQVVNFVAAAAYLQVFLFKKGVEKLFAKGAKVSDLTPTKIRDACLGEELQSPEHLVKLDPDNQHLYKWPMIGEWQDSGQAKILVTSKTWLKPLPYWMYPGDLVCTPKGAVHA
jgi:urea transport system substrate-binding protein